MNKEGQALPCQARRVWNIGGKGSIFILNPERYVGSARFSTRCNMEKSYKRTPPPSHFHFGFFPTKTTSNLGFLDAYACFFSLVPNIFRPPFIRLSAVMAFWQLALYSRRRKLNDTLSLRSIIWPSVPPVPEGKRLGRLPLTRSSFMWGYSSGGLLFIEGEVN